MDRTCLPTLSALRALRVLSACVLLCGALAPAGHAAPGADARHAQVRAPGPDPAPRSAGRPSWLDAGQARAREGLRLLRSAAAHGLDPERYHATALERRLDALADGAADPDVERELEAAVLRFLAELHGGRLPSDYGRETDTVDSFDAAEQLDEALRSGRLDQAAQAAAPRIPLYRRVQASLARYQELARDQPKWPALPDVAGAGITAGSAYEGAAPLRERLALLGDLDAGADGAPADAGLYTPELAQAVRRFQSRHGLEEDGVLGRRTLAALAVPPARRADQLALTLERLRWLPPLPRGRIVAINLPAYRLWAFDGSDDPPTPVLEMRVIVGKAAGTPTPLFIGRMRYLEFNPYWNVPRSIALAEILPRLAHDPAYLERNDMELVTPAGRPASTAARDAPALLRAGAARVRQRPGVHNVLGALKFAMPNPMNIYLHSTSATDLFQRTRRDLSHGCIRVEDPIALAEFVLADPDTWNADGVQAAIRDGRTRTVQLPAPVPVILFYATALTDRAGRAIFVDDIYGRDASLIRKLQAD